jgi:hypothetical protein
MFKGAGSFSGNSIKSSLIAFIRNLSRGRAAPKPAPSMMEELESRLLLSALPVATHDFSIHHGAGVNRPFDTASPVGLTPAQIQQAYGINAVQLGGIVGDGSGQTIAIVDAYDDPNIVADLQTFDSQFNLPAPPSFTVIGQSGSATRPRTDPTGRGNSWAVEISLDVEWAHAVAPKANILLVEASSDSDSDLFSAVNTAKGYTGVSVVSMSWGTTEFSGETSYDSYFTTPAGHNGVTFVAASGDNGAYGSGFGHTLVADYPSSSPNVLSVGGTSLTVDASGNYISETGWGNGNTSGRNGGSGGGISRYERQPAYQNGVVTQSTAYRTTPDVAIDGDPNSGLAVVDSWDFGASAPWAEIGGTSMAAPMWAGLIAIADQGAVLAGGSTFTSAQTLRKLYSLPASDFHDITSGNSGYAAGPGYDLVTGRGSPIANLLVAGLAGPVAPVPVIGALTASPTSGLAGTSVTLTASNVQESSGSATISTVAFYRESNGVAGLQVGGDTLLGTAAQNGTTWTCSFDTTGLSTGTYTFYAAATDSSNVTGAAASTTFQVVVPVPVIGSLTASPTSGLAGTSVTLTASNVHESIGSATISTVSFYRESNGAAGLQVGGDTLLGTAAQNGTTWTYSFDTTGLADGKYTFYVTATDSNNVIGAAASTTFQVTLPAPANDSFANATVLTGNSATATGNNATATKEPSEPNIAGNQGGKSVWYAWTATSNGMVQINTEGSNFDTLLGVYTGTAVSSLTTVAQSDDVSRRDLTSAVSFTATAGTTYYIAVDGYNARRGAGAASGNIALNLTAVQAPANDNFANAAVLTGSSVTVTGNNTAATKEPGEPNVMGNLGGKSVWYAWTATSNGTVQINTKGSDFDTMLGVYTGAAVSSLTTVAENDDVSRRDNTSAVSFTATAGTTYYIVVDGYNNGRGAASGNIVLNLTAVQTPANDSFANATALTGAAATWAGTNAGAAREPGEPNITGNLGGASVWLAWVAPTNGTVTINTQGSDFDTMLGVYTGAGVSSLTTVAENDDVSRRDHTSAVSFSATAGTTYYIAVDGYNNGYGAATGNIVLNLALVQDQAQPPASGTTGGGGNRQPHWLIIG